MWTGQLNRSVKKKKSNIYYLFKLWHRRFWPDGSNIQITPESVVHQPNNEKNLVSQKCGHLIEKKKVIIREKHLTQVCLKNWRQDTSRDWALNCGTAKSETKLDVKIKWQSRYERHKYKWQSKTIDYNETRRQPRSPEKTVTVNTTKIQQNKSLLQAHETVIQIMFTFDLLSGTREMSQSLPKQKKKAQQYKGQKKSKSFFFNKVLKCFTSLLSLFLLVWLKLYVVIWVK